MADVLIGLGSNLGDREGWFRSALDRLSGHPRIEVVSVSPLYETDPVGGPRDQGLFLNACATLDTSLEPSVLLRFMLDIERDAGRIRTVKDAPRTLDLDLLLYGDCVIEEPGLSVPHPAMAERPFVMAPAAALVGARLHPVSGRTLADLASVHDGATGIVFHAATGWWRDVTEANG